MPPKVEGLSHKQTRALRLLALGGGAMDLGKGAHVVRFTHPEGGLHVDLPTLAIDERLIPLGYLKNMGLGTYMITPEGKEISDETAKAYREMWKPHQGLRTKYAAMAADQAAAANEEDDE